MDRLTVTVDTNNLAPREVARLEAAASGLPIEFAHVTVSDREMEGFEPQLAPAQILETGVWGESRWGEAVWGGPDGTASSSIPEAFVLGESRLDEAALAGDGESDRFERLLSLISRGTFPRAGSRDTLTKGQRRHLRDAMIVSGHLREGRDILISDDWTRTPSLLPAVRDLITNEFPNIRIMTAQEFVAYCASLRQRTPPGCSREPAG
ncbi:MAG: hypothetical protein AB7I38_04040 [Dehalococcoidia bacterium]